jgi:tetrahydromethanopterin S-methyltransferase subunit F
MDRREEERLRYRRQFVVRMAPLGVTLIVVGLLLAGLASGFLEIFGYCVLISGLGVLLALAPIAFGNNPRQKDR